MPGVAGLTPARFALGLSADFRTTPGLIFLYSCSGEIAVTGRTVVRVTCLLAVSFLWELASHSCLLVERKKRGRQKGPAMICAMKTSCGERESG
jgi:hypothetical protein